MQRNYEKIWKERGAAQGGSGIGTRENIRADWPQWSREDPVSYTHLKACIYTMSLTLAKSRNRSRL